MDITAIKGLGIGVLFVIAFVGGLVPLCCIKDYGESSGPNIAGNGLANRAISLLNSAAAGIFLSIALIHLLPDVRIIFENSLGSESSFEWAGFTAAMGFLLIVFVEQFMTWCLERTESDIDPTATDDAVLVSSSDPHDDDSASKHYDTFRDTRSSQVDSRSNASSHHSSALEDLQPVTTFRAIILLVSLSLHGILEGLALGLQLDKTAAIDLLIAISLHKAVESFTVLLRFAQIPDRTVIKWTSLVIFSLTSPLGIAIGIPVAKLATGSGDQPVDPNVLLVNGILQGLATGTFMFVTFVELLPVELAGKNDRLLKCASLLAGFGLMCGLTQV